MFFSIEPSPEWYEKDWFAPKPMKLPWRAPALLVSLAAVLFAVWLGSGEESAR